MKNENEIYCTLNKPVVTDTHCFIPEKTQVRVLEWNSKKKKALIETRIFVYEGKNKKDLEVCTCYVSPEILTYEHTVWGFMKTNV